MGAHNVAPKSRCWLRKYYFANVDCDVVVGRSLKKTTHQLHMFFIRCRKNNHVLDYSSAVLDVIEDFGDATAVVVSCMLLSRTVAVNIGIGQTGSKKLSKLMIVHPAVPDDNLLKRLSP